MKKIILVLVIIFATSFVFTSCKSEKKEKHSVEEVSSEKHNDQIASTYQCPMNCEDDKTYKKEGDCPVCKMKLKKKTSKKENKEHH